MSEGTFGNPRIVEEELDILLIGGGMACCGAAYEMMRWAEAAKAETGVDLKIKLVDKAAMDRSGAVAQGLSAINTYIGPNMDPADYARMVCNDLMGITRDDLAYDLGPPRRRLGAPVRGMGPADLEDRRRRRAPRRRRVAARGHPQLKDGGKPVRSGKWQIMINGESYKWIVAEAAKKALGLDRIAGARLHRQARQRQERPEPHRRRRRLLGAREQDLRLQGQGDPARRRRLREPVPPPLGRRRHGPRLVPGVERRLAPTRWPPRPAPR